MKKDHTIWQLINDCKQHNVTVGLMVVISSQGSSPGRQSFKMAVAADGRLAGSIGGGTMEYGLVDLLRTHAWHAKRQVEVRPLVHRKKATQNPSGMICAGEQVVVLYPDVLLSTDLAQTALSIIEQQRTGKLTFRVLPLYNVGYIAAGTPKSLTFSQN